MRQYDSAYNDRYTASILHGSLQEAAEDQVTANAVKPPRNEAGSVASDTDIVNNKEARSTKATIVESIMADCSLTRLDRDNEEELIAEVTNEPSLVVSTRLHKVTKQTVE